MQDFEKLGAFYLGREYDLAARKSDEAYEEWVRQQRDRAYVELRLEDR